MASYGIPQEEIADVLDIDPKTLRKHYSREIRIAATVANSAVAQSMFQKATDPSLSSASVNAAKFWLECRANWRPARAESNAGEIVPEILGKKAQLARDAENAADGTDWGDDLNPRMTLN